jgi:hypothetical protein
VEGGSPEAAGEAEYPEILMVHRLPPLAFSIPTLPQGPSPRLAISLLRRSATRVLSKSFGPVERPDHLHEDLFSNDFVAAGFAFLCSFLFAQRCRDAVDAVAGVAVDPAHTHQVMRR